MLPTPCNFRAEKVSEAEASRNLLRLLRGPGWQQVLMEFLWRSTIIPRARFPMARMLWTSSSLSRWQKGFAIWESLFADCRFSPEFQAEHGFFSSQTRCG